MSQNEAKTRHSGAKGNANSVMSQQSKAEKIIFINNYPLRKQSPKSSTYCTTQNQSCKERVGLIYSPTISRKGLSVDLPVLIEEYKVAITSHSREIEDGNLRRVQ